MNIAVFLDRDGTINLESGYVDSLARFHVLPGVPEAIKRLNDHHIPTIVVTNQSGIARGYFTMALQDSLHKKLEKELKRHESHIDGLYICPHHPDDRCPCRKPRPGMLLKAAREKRIRLSGSYVVGDKMSDIRLAQKVAAKGILVLTGYGAEEIRSRKERPDFVAKNLTEAVRWILKDIEKEEIGKNRKRILIVKPSSLGDIVHALPVLYRLRQEYPHAHIAWLVKEEWKDILATNPLLDELIILRKGIRGFMDSLQEVRKGHFDMVIDLQGLFRSGVITFLSGSSVRIGFSNARELAHIFYNRKTVPPEEPIHAVDRYMLTLKEIIHGSPGFSGGPYPGMAATDPTPVFPLYPEIEDFEWVNKFLKKHNLADKKPLIAINPFARWEKKRWPLRLFLTLIKSLIYELKAGIILLGSLQDINTAEEMVRPLKKDIAIAAGKTTLRNLVALLDQSDLLVTNDSGPMHIASALGTPVVALFGPTSPALTGPYGKIHRVIKKDLECSPCFRKSCVHKRPLCMEAITIEEVMQVVRDKLSSSH